jgi:hypothetical protein
LILRAEEHYLLVSVADISEVQEDLAVFPLHQLITSDIDQWITSEDL